MQDILTLNSRMIYYGRQTGNTSGIYQVALFFSIPLQFSIPDMILHIIDLILSIKKEISNKIFPRRELSNLRNTERKRKTKEEKGKCYKERINRKYEESMLASRKGQMPPRLPTHRRFRERLAPFGIPCLQTSRRRLALHTRYIRLSVN